MALTVFQRDICRLLAQRRIASGESYVADGTALNELTSGSRVSRDIDLFHDTHAALASSWAADRDTLSRAGYDVQAVNERPGFVEAVVLRGDESVLVQWTHESAYRYFPLIEHPELGATLHPLDLATNKVLALAGRVEARDWVDIIHCDKAVQPFGYLAWAASGKDPGFSPLAILEHAARTARYTPAEVDELDFGGVRPDLTALSGRWREILCLAREVVGKLPAEHAGECVMTDRGPFRGGPEELIKSLAEGTIWFHKGSIRGAFPRIVS
jgi:hypothetical protein